ncbi:MAG: DUF4258 domain-containing protein [Planctomycetes bacterium]|nr:DUF4258 domain-containing protein [Planctomycetota bacterium]
MGYKGIPFKQFSHALRREKERRVSLQEIRAVLDAPDIEVPSRQHPGRKVLKKRVSRTREIGVVIVPPVKPRDPVYVVTAWANVKE